MRVHVRRGSASILAAALTAAITLGACTAPPDPGGGATSSTVGSADPRTEMISVASDGTQGNGSSAGATAEPFAPAISADGRFVAFVSTSTNFAGDGNSADVFLRDRTTGTTTLVSGGQSARYPAISADGRFVAFTTTASTLVAGDTNGVSDVFVWDRTTGATERVSVGAGGVQGDAASGYGTSGAGSAPSLSGDGRYVAFVSNATNLVAGDTNGERDVFVRDRTAGVTTRVSVSSTGAQTDGSGLGNDWPSISDDGRYVAFQASALIPGNVARNVFVHDRATGQVTLVSATTNTGANSGPEGTAPAISADGRHVTFHSPRQLTPDDVDSGNYYDVYVRDLAAGTIRRAPGGDGNYHAYYPDVSADGRFVAFETNQPLVADDTNFGTGHDVYVWDTATGAISRASVASDGTQSDDHSEQAAISSTGRFVAFASFASTLVPGDTKDGDVFLRDRGN